MALLSAAQFISCFSLSRFLSAAQHDVMPDETPVTLAQLKELLVPVTDGLDALTRKVNALERPKPAGLLNSSDVKWKKEGTKAQYDAWSTAWDHVDKGQESLGAGDHEKAKESLKEGKDIIEKQMRDVLCANQYGWDWVKEYNAPPLALNSEDETKFRKISKAVAVKRDKLKKQKPKFPYGSTSNMSMWQMRKALQAMMAGKSNLSEFSSSSKDLPKIHPRGTGDRYANMTCNACGLKGHIWSGCPTRHGSKTASTTP